MRIRIAKSMPAGEVSAPPSKSMAHRLLICAGLAAGKSVIRGVDVSQDVLATLDCLKAMGADVQRQGDTVVLQGTDAFQSMPKLPLCCRESGSTLRFFIPIALLSGMETRFEGSEYLLNRPLSVYETLCAQKGMTLARETGGIRVQGPLQGGEIRLRGDVSSQFVSGLLFALPLLACDSCIRLIPPVESRSYIDLTRSAMADFGVRISWADERTLQIPGNQRYRCGEHRVEGDHSNGAFFEAMNALGGNVRITGLNEASLQGDRVCKAYLQALQAGAAHIDLSDCPDLGPVLFAAAAALHGGVFTGTRRLRIKESDRAQAMAQELEKCGGCVTVEEDRVIVEKRALHAPLQAVDGHNDHRIVMAMSVLLCFLGGSIQGAEAVRKSYPGFFDDLQKTGVQVERESK